MKKALYASLALCLAACGDKTTEVSANRLAGNDFESIDGWISETPPPSLTKEKAHSGRYAIKVDANTEYSLGYNNLLGKLSASKLKKLKVHAWVNMPDKNSQAVLVAQISDPANPSKPLMWEGINLAEEVKTYNKWVEVEKIITLPVNITYTNKLGVYLWRTNSSGATFVDDLTIEKAE